MDRSARRSRRRQTRLFAAAGAALALAGGVGVFALSGGGDTGERAALKQAPVLSSVAPADAIAAPSTLPFPKDTIIATTKGGPITVYANPGDVTPKLTLSPKTDYGVTRTLLVTQQHDTGWLEVLLPLRPNGDKGWIRPADVNLTTTTYEIKVDLQAHTLVLRNGNDVILQTKVVIGKASTPTPPGLYYITDPVDLQANPTSEYGAFALGISGYSEVLFSFGGGPGQLAVHGTPRPGEVGQDLSNGCVRVPDAVALRIANTVPLGTPVRIV